MPNYQIWPQVTSPLAGDIQSNVGNPDTTVVGIQTVPVVSTTPQDQQSIVFQASEVAYVPTFSPFNRAVQCNNVAVSDDYDFYCNGIDVSTNQVNSATSPASQLVYCNGSPVG